MIEVGHQKQVHTEPYHVVVIGGGHIGFRHLEILNRFEQVNVMALSSRPERRAQLESLNYKTVRDLDELPRTSRMLAVIATDTACHERDSLMAMELGYDILVEKPLAVNASSAERIRDCGIKKNRRVFVGCVLRFSESMNMFRKSLSDLGSIHNVQIECHSYLPDWRPNRPYQESYSARREEGGVLRDLIHEIDYAGWLFGWPQTLQAKVKNLHRLGIRSDEIAHLFWETDSGTFVSITVDFLSRPNQRQMKAFGERGSLEWDGVTREVILRCPDAQNRQLRSHQSKEELYTAQIQEFLSVCDGEENLLLATDEEGCRAMSVCDAARRASESGQEEKVEYAQGK